MFIHLGGVKVALDVGFGFDELPNDISDVDLANGQQHVVVVKRTNKGRTMTIYVDDYPPKVKTWTLPDMADTKLDNPKYIYMGRNGRWNFNFHHFFCNIAAML